MTERPIIFSIDMVRAIFEGRKTQTRRVIKGYDIQGPHAPGSTFDWYHHPLQAEWAGAHDSETGDGNACQLCPYGSAADRLWVRESHYRWDGSASKQTVVYLDGYWKDWGNGYETHIDINDFFGAKTPSIHMPRWASRLTLTITKVRVERIQEISREDVECEGCSNAVNNPMWFPKVWDRLNAKRGHSWDANPWVWVIEFPPLRC